MATIRTAAGICAHTLLLVSFAAAVALGQATEGGYRRGPGDQIIIKVFGEDDLSMRFRLNDTGELNYPFLGEIRVEGLTVAELEQRITQGLKGMGLSEADCRKAIAHEYGFNSWKEVTGLMLPYRPLSPPSG